jgi:hypothetical protein
MNAQQFSNVATEFIPYTACQNSDKNKALHLIAALL